MPATGKVFDQSHPHRVFVSYAHTDHDLCRPLRDALDSWNVAYWYDAENARIGHRLLDELLTNVRESDILLRVCTPAAAESAWMHRELGMFLAFQKERSLRDVQYAPRIVNICFDGYTLDDPDREYLYINATSLPTGGWLDYVRRALDLPMGWVKFAEDDDSYLWWIRQYPQGYVVSADRRPRVGWLTLHRPTCHHVSNVERWEKGAFCERDFIKICALDRSELERWAREQVDPAAVLNGGCNCMR